ncbi:MAG: hypothetical protein JW836_02040 [Deltaproteobacteria bacterium]|nr:hypothetical protein [Deltaproteobacteria bacterium]
MKVTKAGLFIPAMVFALILCRGVSLADKSAVILEAPDQASKGDEITVKIHVTHSGNSFVHYTNWVKVTVNGKEKALWEYSAGSRPENDQFTKEIKVTINGPTEIVAQANCNLHGSRGPARKIIRLKE